MSIVKNMTSGLVSKIVETVGPDFSLNFSSGTLPDGFTFTRSTTATYYDENGYTKTAAINTPRFQDGGFLIEEQKTNYATQSNMSNWTSVRGSWSLDSGETGIDGVSGVYKFVADTSPTTSHYAQVTSVDKPSATSIDMIMSWKIKKNASNELMKGVRLYVFPQGSGSADSVYVDIDWSSDEPSETPFRTRDGGGALNLNDWGFYKLGDYYRFYVCFNTGEEAQLRFILYPLTDGGSTNFTGDGITAWFWAGDFQLEETVFSAAVQGSLGHQPSSLITTTGATATRGTEVLTADGSYGDTTGMSLICDFKPIRFNLDEPYQYPVYLDDSRDSKSTEIKIRNDSNPQRLWSTVRGSDNIGFNGRSLGGTVVAGVRTILGVTWESDKIRTIGKGAGDLISGQTPLVFNHADFNKIFIGSRNSGADPINGIVYSIKIFNQYLHPSLLSIYSTLRQKYTYFLSGQSLAQRKDDAITNGIEGTKKYNEQFRQYRGVPVEIWNGATGGSAVLKSNASVSSPTNYWLNDDDPNNLIPDGIAWLAWKEGVDAGYFPNDIEWCQGEADASGVTNSAEKEFYKNALLFLFDTMKLYSGNNNMRVFIQGLGRRDPNANDIGTQLIRAAQIDLAYENNFIHVASFGFDLQLSDSVHIDNEGNGIVATRTARYINSLDGYIVSGEIKGAYVTNVSRSGETVTVTTSKDTTGELGFVFFDDGVEIAHTTSRINATTIELTLASAPTGVEELYFIYGSGNGDITNANVSSLVKSTTTEALPMQPSYYKNIGSGFVNQFLGQS